ncbi:MAG: hypothetical protein M3O70_18585 [Actinomycetota bacterium]|nr:hypothetical protein [Actinomycetota bacterium]
MYRRRMGSRHAPRNHDFERRWQLAVSPHFLGSQAWRTSRYCEILTGLDILQRASSGGV